MPPLPDADAPRVPGEAVADVSPASGGGARAVGAVVFVAVLFAIAGGGLVAATAARSWFPGRWDPRVAPIADQVARLRGLDFRHPVTIRYLAPADFEKRIGTDGKLSAGDRAEIAREESVFRALGFIGGKVDLLHAQDAAQTSSTLAYYDPASEQIYVRGTTLDVQHRVTIAHEMTHVLQDQHFDLEKLQKQARRSDEESALTALVEGDAVRVQEDYLHQLSPADQAEYAREDAAEGARIKKETSSVPLVVAVLDEAPYDYGPPTVRVLLADGGNAAVNRALEGPAPSTSDFVDAGVVAPPRPVDEPPLPSGGTQLGKRESFDAFETYLTLASRIDPVRALTAADVVGGGRAVAFRSKGETCYRVVLATTSGAGRDYVASAVGDWARGRARTAVDDAGDQVGFTACDPGTSTPAPASQSFQHAVNLLAVRSELAVAAAREQLPPDTARCVARVFVQAPGAADLILAIGDNQPTAAQNGRLRALAAESGSACHDDSGTGLP